MKKSSFDDEEIIKLFESGKISSENIAIKFILQQYRDKLIAFLLNRGLPAKEDAEEIMYDAIISLRGKAISRTFEVKEKNSIKSYLYKVCENLYKQRWRKHFKNTDLKNNYKTEIIEEDTLSKLLKKDKSEFIMYLISTIGESCKKILLKRFFNNMKHDEIAEEMDYKNAQISRNKISRCLNKLRNSISKSDYDKLY